jgi:hypothetical protein
MSVWSRRWNAPLHFLGKSERSIQSPLASLGCDRNFGPLLTTQEPNAINNGKQSTVKIRIFAAENPLLSITGSFS